MAYLVLVDDVDEADLASDADEANIGDDVEMMWFALWWLLLW